MIIKYVSEIQNENVTKICQEIIKEAEIVQQNHVQKDLNQEESAIDLESFEKEKTMRAAKISNILQNFQRFKFVESLDCLISLEILPFKFILQEFLFFMGNYFEIWFIILLLNWIVYFNLSKNKILIQ